MAFRNPFQATDAPDHMVEERRKRHRHIAQTIVLCIVVTIFALFMTPFIAYGVKNHIPFNKTTFGYLVDYLKLTFSNNAFVPHEIMARDPTALPGFLPVIPGHDDAHLRVILAYVFVGLLACIIAATRQLFNSSKKMVMKADAAWAKPADLEQMEDAKQVGIRNADIGALGRWQGGLRNKQVIARLETISLLCMAPPGTGKTAALVIPSIIHSDGMSILVNDQKPELFQATSGHRSTVSHVYMLDWSKVDEPEKQVYYPRFNFLSPKIVPPPGPDRDTYLDSVAKILIPEKSSGDSYFINKGRAALTGFMHLLVAKVGDAGNYEGIPARWQDKEPSLPMFAEWYAAALFRAAQKKDNPMDDDDYDGPPDEIAPPANQGEDLIGSWIKEITASVDPALEGPGRSARAFNELAQLISMADKERSGVLGTMDEALLPFKNQAVQQRTSASDFTPDDFRGIFDQEIEARTKLPESDPEYLDPTSKAYKKLYDDPANWKPLSLYICVNQADAPAFTTITALLYEVIARSLLSYGPGEYNPKTKRKLGPYPVSIILDEFAKLPKIDAVIELPDLGRSKKVFVDLYAQSHNQIVQTYGRERAQTIYSTTGVKVLLAQNDTETIDIYVKMVGRTTIRRSSKSSTVGFHVKNLWNDNVSDTAEETEFLRMRDVGGMSPDECIIIVQRFLHRPIKARTLLYFKDPDMLAMVHNPRTGKGPVAKVVLPDFIQMRRQKEFQQEKAREEAQQRVIVNLTDEVTLSPNELAHFDDLAEAA